MIAADLGKYTGFLFFALLHLLKLLGKPIGDSD